MKTIHALYVSAVLAAIGLGLFCYKVLFLEFPLQPNKQSQSWYIEAKIAFDGKSEPAKLDLFIPQNTGNYVIVDENFISQGYGLSTKILKSTPNRLATWTRRKAQGKQMLFYRAALYELESTISPSESDEAAIAIAKRKIEEHNRKMEEEAEARKQAGEPVDDKTATEAKPVAKASEPAEEDPYNLAMKSLVGELREHSADTPSFVSELYKALSNKDDDRLRIIRNAKRDVQGRSGLAALILEEAGIPTRIINGLHLEGQKRQASFEKWLEVYDRDNGWRALDIKTGEFGLTGKYFPWWQGNSDMFELEGGRRPEITISVRQNTEDAITKAIWKGQTASEALFSFSLFSLPIDSQIVFRVLLLVPVGGLVIAFLRQVIGLKTFGTFMPVLVALSFREMQLFWGVVLFTSVVFIGMMIRDVFDKLQLLMVPRLAAVLTIVVLLIAFLSIVLYKLGINAGLSISLFPMIILTMTIERMSIMWEENGPKTAISTGLVSLFAAVVAYIGMSHPLVTHLVFVFPELLLVVLALTILLGRYNGYKLTEYKRFKSLVIK